MNHFNLHNQISQKMDSNVDFVPSFCAFEKNGLLNVSLTSIFSPSNLQSNSPICVISNIAESGKQDKAWMLRKIVTAGRRMKFSS